MSVVVATGPHFASAFLSAESICPAIYKKRKSKALTYTGTMLAAMRFIWNATRGARLRPWRSPYVRWRIETYSGLHAETLTGRDVLRFTWRERRQLLRFLRWSSEMNTGMDARKKVVDES